MLLVVVIWGANFSFMKMALAEMSGMSFAGLRFALAAVVLLAVLYWREGSIALPREAWWTLIWMGLLSNTLYQVFFMYGLTHTSVANASLIIATTPLIVALLGAVTGIEALSRPVVTGGLLGVCGCGADPGGEGSGARGRAPRRGYRDLRGHPLLGPLHPRRAGDAPPDLDAASDRLDDGDRRPRAPPAGWPGPPHVLIGTA